MTNPFALDTPPASPAPAVAAQPSTPAPVAAQPNPAVDPQYQAFLAQQAAAQQQAQAAPAQPAATGALDDPFAGPAPQQPRGPRMREMYGRLLLLRPQKVEDVLNKLDPKGGMQKRLTADVIILDGGPIEFGGKPEAMPPIPHDKTAQVPHKTEGMFISSAGIVSQCRIALEERRAGKPGLVLGRLTRGERKGEQEAPWLLSAPTEADKAIARQYLASVDPFA